MGPYFSVVGWRMLRVALADEVRVHPGDTFSGFGRAGLFESRRFTTSYFKNR